MRIATRIIGGLLIFAGLGCLAITGSVIASEGWRSWLFITFMTGVAGGLFLGGRYYWRMDVDTPDEEEPPRPASPFVAAHRRELSVLAQVGLFLSLFRLIVLCLGSDVPRWVHWTLTIGCLALLVIAPTTPRAIPKWASQILTIWFLGLALFGFFVAWAHWFRLPQSLKENGLSAGFFVFLYALEALSFTYCVVEA